MNKCIVIGNLTKEPELRTTQSGLSVCTFTVAVSRTYKNAQGEKEADFIPVVCWRALADNCSKYLAKGRKAAVCGSIQTRTYEANDGTKRYATEILAEDVQFLDKAPAQEQQEPDTSGYEYEDVGDDDLPF